MTDKATAGPGVRESKSLSMDFKILTFKIRERYTEPVRFDKCKHVSFLFFKIYLE